MSFTIESGKEAGVLQSGVIPRPLMLCQITSISGDTVYLTTTPALGGSTLTYESNNYQARLLSNPIDQIQAMSPQGYDIPGSISLTIDDGDFVIWNEHANYYGWKGGTLTVTMVLLDLPSFTYSTNSYTWTFILDKPNVDATGILTVAGQAKQSMTRINVPNVPRQNRCSHDFPSTYAQRLDGATNPTSIYAACRYSPDITGLTGITPLGNKTTANLTNPDGSALTDSNGVYVMCDYTRSCGSGKQTLTQGCMARLGNYSATHFYGNTIPCGADGDIIDDEQGNRTGHFDGDTWLAPVGWKGRQYDNPSAGTQYGFNTPNPPTGSTYYNMGYGTQWVTATVLAPAGNINSNLAECVVCIAPNGPANIITVLVQGVQLQEANPDVNFTYRVLNTNTNATSLGGPAGTVSVNSAYNGQGDPHGSLCWLQIEVPVELTAAGSIPNVQVLVQFPNCLHALPIATAVAGGGSTVLTLASGVSATGNGGMDGVVVGQSFYLSGNSATGSNGGYIATAVTLGSMGTPGTVTISGTINGNGGAIFYYPTSLTEAAMVDGAAAAQNPVWALMDLLTWGPWTPDDFDVQTWWDAASFCAVAISYNDINGNSASHARYRCSFVLSTNLRQSLAKAVLGVRNCAGIILARNPQNGLLQCFIEQTLADQQPSPITGSNYNSPVASLTAGSTAPLTPSLSTPGYLAYLFDGAGSIEEGTFKIGGRSLNDTPNTFAFPFQDSANVWVQDTITTIDPSGYQTSGNQEIQAPFQVLGIENFDQGTRRSNTEQAKASYGNIRFDAGGTDLFSFRTSVKAVHLLSMLGAICGINYEQLGVDMVLARLLGATPTSDGEHIDLSFRFHYDAWHTDAYDQDPAPYQRSTQLGGRQGLPYPWRPNANVWPVDDALFAFMPGFQMTLSLASYPALLSVSGTVPVNSAPPLAPTPQVPPMATVSSTGGYITPGTYLIAISANGYLGPVAPYFVTAIVPAGTNTNSVTISNIVWPGSAAPLPMAFAGIDSLHMGSLLGPPNAPNPDAWFANSSDANGNPTSITFPSLTGSLGLPDSLFNQFLIQGTAITVPGSFLTTVTSVTGAHSNVLTTANGGSWTVNSLDRPLALYYRPGASPCPAFNVIVGTNTASTMTLQYGIGIGTFQVGDVVVLRLQAASYSPNTISDNLVNLVAGSQVGNTVLIIAGTGANQAPKTIQSHTSGVGAVVTINGTWDIEPDFTSTWIIVSPSPQYSQYSGSITNSDPTDIESNVAGVPLTWAPAQSIYVTVSACDVNGNCYPPRYQPARELYVPAQSLQPSVGYTITPVGGNATVDLANGLIQILDLNATAVTVLAPIWTGGSIITGTSFTLICVQDSTGNRVMPTFTGGTAGFASNTSSQIIVDGTALTSTSTVFVFNGAVWVLTSQQTGITQS